MKAFFILKSIDGAPDTFQLLPYGRIEIEGEPTAFLDDEGMESIIAHFKRRGNDMVIDYEHQTLKDVQAPAAAWVKDIFAKGKEGLWVMVEWTEQGRQYVANKEYRYFSPVMWVTDKDRKVVKIENIALTNFPKVNQLRPIISKMNHEEARVAQRRRAKKYGISIKDGGHVTKPGEWSNVPDDEFLDPVNYRYPCPNPDQTRSAASYWGQADNQAQYTLEERVKITARLNKFRKKFKIGEYRKEAKMWEKLKKLFGLAEDTGEDKVVEAAEAIVAKNKELEKAAENPAEVVACKEVLEVLKVDDDADVTAVIAAINALGKTDDVAKELSLQVAKLTKELSEMKQNDLVALALKEGKTSPEELDKWGRDLALKNPKQFELIVLSRPAGSVIPVEKIKHKDDPKPGEADEIQLSINKMMGIEDETWKKYNPDAQAS